MQTGLYCQFCDCYVKWLNWFCCVNCYMINYCYKLTEAGCGVVNAGAITEETAITNDFFCVVHQLARRVLLHFCHKFQLSLFSVHFRLQ